MRMEGGGQISYSLKLIDIKSGISIRRGVRKHIYPLTDTDRCVLKLEELISILNDETKEVLLAITIFYEYKEDGKGKKGKYTLPCKVMSPSKEGI